MRRGTPARAPRCGSGGADRVKRLAGASKQTRLLTGSTSALFIFAAPFTLGLRGDRMSSMRGRSIAFLVMALLVGCAPARETPRSVHATNARAGEQERAFHELTADLALLRDPGPVLDALPATLKAAGRALLAKSSPTERRQLLDSKTGLASPQGYTGPRTLRSTSATPSRSRRSRC